MFSNPVLQQMRLHASVRHFQADPVPPEALEAIIDAGQRAATSSNLQAYSVIAVTDPIMRAELAGLCGDQEQISQAPLFLAWCADLSRIDRATVLRGHPHIHDGVENFLLAAVDASLAAQNAALAAESLGLGVCYIGALRNSPREVIRLLALPRLVFPLFGMTVGVPLGPAKPRPRLPMQAILHHEQYSRAGEDQALGAYDVAMIETGIYCGRQVPVPGRPGQVEDYGWTEHTARRVSKPVRPHLRSVLAEQGFGLI